jgi:hypothetical protein
LRDHGNYAQANVTRNLSKRYILRNDVFNFVIFLTIQPREGRF